MLCDESMDEESQPNTPREYVESKSTERWT